MITRRFREAASLLINDDVICETKGISAHFFKVQDYGVTISDKNGCICTCEYGSMWGLKKKWLPCKHILAVMMAETKLNGPMLRKRWQNPLLKLMDIYNNLPDKQKKQFQKELKNHG